MVRSLRHRPLAISRLVRPVVTRSQHLKLPSRQRPARARPNGRRQLVQTSQIRLCAEPLEDGARRLMFESRRLVVAEGATGPPDEHPHARRLVRRLEAFPELERAAEPLERRQGIALGERDRPIELDHDRAQDIGIECLGERSKLVVGTPGLLQIADRGHDLEVCRQAAGRGAGDRRARRSAGESPHTRRRYAPAPA